MADEQPAPAPDAPWLVLQKKIFARYVSQALRKAGIKQSVTDIIQEMKDGLLLIQLVEAMSGKSFGAKPKPSNVRIQQIDNVNRALNFVKDNGIKHKASAEDIVDGNATFVLGLVFAVIIKYMKLDEEDSESSDIKEALMLWLRNRLSGYDIPVESFTKTFQDGLAFCALIHKMRPKLIPFETLDKKNKLDNLRLALDTAAKYCNVEKYLAPEDIANLDEIGMIVYLYDWYFGVSLLQKQDAAARRVGKLADMTKLHDQMRADYNSGAAALVSWIDGKVTQLGDRTIDNKMAGIRARLDTFYAYKSHEKGEKLVESLDLQALFDNLALRLRNNKRPPFQPAQSLELIESKFKQLEEAEFQCSTFLHTELERQIKLDKLGKRFRAEAQHLDAFLDEKRAVANTVEPVDTIDIANYHLEAHAVFEQEIDTAKKTRVANISKLYGELAGEQYEFAGELKALLDSLDAKVAALEAASTAKRTALLGELEKQKQINDTLCKSFADAVNKFSAFLTAKKDQLGDKNADLNTLLAFVESSLANTAEADALLAAVAEVDGKVEARQITLNPYTTITANDCKAQWYQFTLTLNKKKELLVAEIEASTRSGLSEEQVREVSDNFDYFDKDKSGKLERRELRACLQSLGEDATPADVDRILTQYDKDNDKTINKDEFLQFMLKKLGDSNTKEEILECFKLLSFDKETISLEMLESVVNDLTFKEHHVAYLKANMSSGADGYDYAKWTEEVFAR